MSNSHPVLSYNSSKENINIEDKSPELLASPTISTKMKSGTKRDTLSLRFNQEHNLFASSTDSGLKIYNVEPLAVKATLDPSEVGTISVVELLHRTNLIAIVAGGSKQKYAENTVLIWDDSKKQFVMEFTFSSPVLSIRLRKDRMFVVESSRIHVFGFPTNPKKLYSIDTRDNPKGLCEVSLYPTSERQVVILPGHKTGAIQVIDLSATEPGKSAAPVNINAHQNEVACIALNNQGTLVATASSKGTLIRVHDTARKTLLVELRRGTDQASMFCLNFSPDSDFLCASSDKGTIHIFALKDTHLNRRSTFSKMAFLGQYVESQWALANFTVAAECACVCAFGPKSAIYAICVDGTFHKYVFSQEGTCSRDVFEVYLDLEEEEDF